MEELEEIHVLAKDVLVACVLLGLMVVVGLVGNVLMLRALFRYPKLRIEFYIVLGGVATADIMCLMVSVPMHIIHLTMATEPVTDAWCKASKYLDAGLGFVAAYSLVVLAVLRGILLISRGHNPPTPLQSLLSVGLLWLMAFLAAIPFLMTVENVNGFCHFTIDTNIEKEVWLLNSFSCFIPVVLIIFIYFFTYEVGQRYFDDSYSYREKQMSKLVTVIVVFFVILQLPFRVLSTRILYKELEAEEMGFVDEDGLVSLYIARNYLLCVMMADKVVRPVICAKLAPDLGAAFDEVVNCTICQRMYMLGSKRKGTASGGQGDGSNIRTSERRSGRFPSTSSSAPLVRGNERNISVNSTPPDTPPVEGREEMQIAPV